MKRNPKTAPLPAPILDRWCAQCDTPLARARGDHGDYWRCSRCPGHLVPMAVLQQAATTREISREIRRLWQAAVRENRRRQPTPAPAPSTPAPELSGPLEPMPMPMRLCPECRQPMVVIAVTSPMLDADSEVDICVADRLVWLDETALAKTLARLRTHGLTPAARDALNTVGVGMGTATPEQFSLWDVAEAIVTCITNGWWRLR